MTLIMDRVSIDKHLLILILGLILVIGSIAYYEVSQQEKETKEKQVIISKLDLLQTEANKSQNVTVIFPNNTNGKVAGLGEPVIVQ